LAEPTIVTVTLNPTLDKTLSVPQLRPGAVHRAQVLRQDLGGKGINVSRALRALGLRSEIVAFVGGRTGQAMRSGLLEAGFDVHWVEVEGETRQNITLLDEASGDYTKINEPGAFASPQHLESMQSLVEHLARPGDLWAFCGSLPPGAPPEYYAFLIRLVGERGARSLLDSSGPALRHGLEAHPFAVKPNSEEAAELLGLSLLGDEDHCAAARCLQARGVSVVALTRGAQGLVLAMDGEVLIATPPPIPTRSPIGAGDAAVAGLLWATCEGCDPVETARRAVACGTATAMQEGTGVGDRPLVERLLNDVKVISC
jgi:1-phosphofructokinase family hexose kinase